jgi:predicted MarR family transcription regulator
MALTGALCHTLLAATGFTNKNLRVLIAGLLGSDYRPGQMTYDLRRLRLTGLIHRIPHSNRYTLTHDGIRVAIFYTKIYNRLLVPLTASDQPQAPPELRQALRTVDHHVADYINHAQASSLKLDTNVENSGTQLI